MSRCDIAIVNGVLVDGTGAPAREGDIGIRGDRIVSIGPTPDADRVIDAKGAVVSPGFVDLHGHSDYSVFLDPAARSKTLQGVTTELIGNCGYSAAPVWGSIQAERADIYQRSCKLETPWASMASYLSKVDELRPAMNIAMLVGYNTVRSAATDDRAGGVTDPEMFEIQKAIKLGLDEGAIGVSVGLAYPSACFSDSAELVRAVEPIADVCRLFAFHMRDEGDKIIESVDEALAVGRDSGVPVQLGHVKTFGRRNWWKIDMMLRRVERAMKRGIDVMCDRYPYIAMNTQLKMILPKWTFDGGEESMRNRMRDDQQRPRLMEELSELLANGEAEAIVISAVAREENKRFESRTLTDSASLAGKSPEEFLADIVAAEGDDCFATFFGMSRENMRRILTRDYIMVASDASVQVPERGWGGSNPHPRCHGTFPVFIEEFVRKRGDLSMPAAIRKMTSQPCERLGIKDRGVLGEGAYADVVIFDSDEISSQATYENPTRKPLGIKMVMCNGKLTVENGSSTGQQPGRALRRGDAAAIIPRG